MPRESPSYSPDFANDGIELLFPASEALVALAVPSELDTPLSCNQLTDAAASSRYSTRKLFCYHIGISENEDGAYDLFIPSDGSDTETLASAFAAGKP